MNLFDMCFLYSMEIKNEWMNEWMNEWSSTPIHMFQYQTKM